MQPRPRKRSRLQFQPPFLAGALGALSLAGGGCGAIVEDGPAGEDGGSGGSEAQDGSGGLASCPAVAPLSGTSCSTQQEGLQCGVWRPCSAQPQVTCEGGIWRNTNPTCNPPPSGCTWPEDDPSCYPLQTHVCPGDPPPVGSACASPGTVCVEATCNDTGLVCGADGTWQENYMSCNPPPIGYGGSDGWGGETGQP